MEKIKENRATFFARLTSQMSKNDMMRVEFAYDIAKESHRTQKRDSGQRYFEHPREGCLILLDEVNLYDADMLITFLLHDVAEDTPILGNRLLSYEMFKATATSRLTLMFGSHVADMVMRLTKPAFRTETFATKDEAFRFYLSRLKESEKAIILKMVDRLHNLRTLPIDKEYWVKKQIIETESVYLPIFSSVTGKMDKVAKVLVSKICFEIKRLKAGQ